MGVGAYRNGVELAKKLLHEAVRGALARHWIRVLVERCVHHLVCAWDSEPVVYLQFMTCCALELQQTTPLSLSPTAASIRGWDLPILILVFIARAE